MSISRAIERAYRVSHERQWDSVYWALDLHGTCLKSNYRENSYEWLDEQCGPIIRELSKLPETKIILWSSVHPAEQPGLLQFFKDAGVEVLSMNSNPLESNTATGYFDQKFYMSIIVDDKAGFEPDEWPLVLETVIASREKWKLFPASPTTEENAA